MFDLKLIQISFDASIRTALEVIDKGAKKIAIVVDGNAKVIGTITDGDIRRALLSGFDLTHSIENIYNRKPVLCSIHDSRDKILKVAIENKFYQIPIVDDNNYLQDVSEVDVLLKPERHLNKVVLMAGGLGTRLRPLTDNFPKTMLKVGSKPILETIINNFSKFGFTNIILSVNYMSHIIEDYFGDGNAFGVNIEYVRETKKLGTAGALSLMRDKLEQPFFVMNGDLLTNINFEHLYDFHIMHKSEATMAVREYDFQIPYGVVKVDNGKISGIDEKPVYKYFISAGIYIVNPSILELISDNDYLDMPDLFNDVIRNKKDAYTFPIHEYWLDIGRMSDYEKANSEYMDVFE